MSKYLLAALLCLCVLNVRADIAGATDNERMLKAAGGEGANANYDRQALTEAIDETMQMVEDLSRQIPKAPKAELDDMWASGERDFKLNSGEVSDSRKACGYIVRARQLEAGPDSPESEDKAKALRSDARDCMRGQHKRKSDDYVRDLRNWLAVSEGTLRHANEDRAAAAAALSPTAAALTATATAK